MREKKREKKDIFESMWEKKKKRKKLLDVVTFQIVLYYAFGKINLYNLLWRPQNQFCQIYFTKSCLIFRKWLYFFVSCRKFRSPYPGKTQQPQEQRYPFLSMRAVFSCAQTMVRLPVFGIFNVHTDADTCDCMQGLYRRHHRLEPASVLHQAFQLDAPPTELSPTELSPHLWLN